MLRKKLFRTIILYKAQFISMILMVFLGVAVFVGINSEWYGMRVESDNFYNEYNLADTWIYSTDFSDTELNTVLDLESVEVAERRLTIDTKLSNTEKAVRLHIIEKGEISKSYITEGEEMDLNADGIWLFDEFAYKNDLEIYDEITLKYNEFSITKKILGLIKNPEYIYPIEDDTVMIPDVANFGYAFLPLKALPFPHIQYNELLLKNADMSKHELEIKVREVLVNKTMIFISRNEHESVQMFDSEIESNKVMGEIFPVVFLLISILSMITTMLRLTTNERVQIGILKALGFSKRKITNHYTSYGLIVGLTGSILGLILGPLTLGKLFFKFQSTMYYLPVWKTHVSPINYIIVFIMVITMVLVCYLACRKNLEGTASESLKPLPPKLKTSSRVGKTKFWNKLSFNNKWNLRDLFRNKIRSFMSIFGVTGCMMLMLCAFAMNDSMMEIDKWMYSDLHRYRTKINLAEDSSISDIEDLRTEVDGETIGVHVIEVRVGEDYYTKNLEIYDVMELVYFEDYDRNRIFLNNEGLYITHKMAESLNIKQGDILSWRIFGTNDFIESEIVGIVRVPVGQGFIMSADYAAKLNIEYLIQSIYTNEVEIDSSLYSIRNIQSKADLRKSLNTFLETMQMIIYIMIFGALTLGTVVLYNLGIISFTERFREFSTLKVLGFQDKQINRLLISQNIWLTIIGIIIGLPLGKALIGIIMGVMPDNLDFSVTINPLSYIICIMLTLTVSILVNLLLFKKTRQIDMVSSLKISE